MNIGQSALQVLKLVAPTLASAFGGPVGAMAYNAIATALNIAPDQPKQVEAALKAATPEQLLALKTAEQAFAAKMKELGIAEEKLAFDDTASARAMNIATKDSTPRNLSYLLLIFTGLVIIMEFRGWAKIEGALAGTLIGYLVSETKAMMQFWFGTTKGSQDMRDTISDIAKAP